MSQENPRAFGFHDDDSDDNDGAILQNGQRRYHPLKHSPTRRRTSALHSSNHSAVDTVDVVSSQSSPVKNRVSRIQPPNSFKAKLNSQKSQGWSYQNKLLELTCKLDGCVNFHPTSTHTWEMLIWNLIYFLYIYNQSHNQGYAAYQDQDLGIGL